MAERIRVAVIGAGWWATAHHIPALRADPRVELVAVVDPRLDHATSVAREHGIPNFFATVEEAIAGAAVDAAVVANPNSAHYDTVKALLSAEIAVLVEKPLTLDSADAAELVELARDKKLLLAVGYTAQYAPAASAARGWVRGDIGQLVQVIIEFSSGAGKLFDTTEPTSTYAAANGSGQAITQLSHAISAALWATGEHATLVGAMTAQRGLPVDIENAVVFRLSGGALGTAAATGALSPGIPLRQRVRYIGTGGTVDHDLIAGTAELQRSTGELLRVAPHHITTAYPAAAPVREFIDRVLEPGENHGDPVAAFHAVAFIEAVHESARRGEFVAVAVQSMGDER